MAEPTQSTDFDLIFSHRHSRIPEDTVFYTIFPDFAVSYSSSSSSSSAAAAIASLHLQILDFLAPLTSSYIWQHEPFSLSISTSTCVCTAKSSPLPHLHGKLRFGDNIEDEWFVVFLLFEVSRNFPSLAARIWDNDGDFLLIEAAFHLPYWLNPDTSLNRVFVRRGEVHIVPRDRLPKPSLVDSLKFLINCESESRATESVQEAIKLRIGDFPERAKRNMHFVRVRLPVSVAQVLKHEPCFISLAVEGFYDRDIDSMKYAAKMERFLRKGKEEELVCVGVKMSRAMYAQLMQQKFQAPKCYPMPSRGDGVSEYLEAELGMKIACGFEMMYQQKKKEGVEGKGSTWVNYKESLERNGYFEGLLPGSEEYNRRMEHAEEYYRKSVLFSRTSDMLSAPVRRIDEILALPYSVEDFRHNEVPPSDDDSWLYHGEDELNSALQEKQKELDLYNAKHKRCQKAKVTKDAGPSSSSSKNLDDFDFGHVAKIMQSFVDKVSSYEGAEVPENRNMKEVELDADRFLREMESVLKQQRGADMESVLKQQRGAEEDGGSGTEEASSSDMDFDEFEYRSDGDADENEEDRFMDTYSDALNEQLKGTTLKKSFIRANDDSVNRTEGTSNPSEGMDEEFTPVDVDFNLVKSLMDSFSSQQGQPGPGSNLLGLMGLQLPQDSNKGK
ncbi:hypothetical protein K2173_025772 [Erythroxylum novogranatense]|uniref:Protein ecdysoneless homolog n=1 Tax=Erythroxylum novogranatense TaxID=1862640 RepID=A0AAV8TVU9_9ROSI|nr:hypothetical protein K2173_025772 [Erythroxylum novogranatense]